MKLLSLLLLGTTALAVAVPAPWAASNTAMAVYARDVDDAPGPDTPYAFKIIVHPRDLISMPSFGMDAPATDGIWDYQVTFTEHFNGKMLHCQGNISTRSGDFVMDYEGEGKFIWVKLNDYDMHIFWDWNEHSKSSSLLSVIECSPRQGHGSSSVRLSGRWIRTAPRVEGPAAKLRATGREMSFMRAPQSLGYSISVF
jgi:hypothetical protein